jgi:hypothetical protein
MRITIYEKGHKIFKDAELAVEAEDGQVGASKRLGNMRTDAVNCLIEYQMGSLLPLEILFDLLEDLDHPTT